MLDIVTACAPGPAQLSGVTELGSKSTALQPGEIGDVSGVPEEHLHRKVRVPWSRSLATLPLMHKFQEHDVARIGF